jgi:hypothetical protein
MKELTEMNTEKILLNNVALKISTCINFEHL